MTDRKNVRSKDTCEKTEHRSVEDAATQGSKKAAAQPRNAWKSRQEGGGKKRLAIELKEKKGCKVGQP